MKRNKHDRREHSKNAQHDLDVSFNSYLFFPRLSKQFLRNAIIIFMSSANVNIRGDIIDVQLNRYLAA